MTACPPCFCGQQAAEESSTPSQPGGEHMTLLQRKCTLGGLRILLRPLGRSFAHPGGHLRRCAEARAVLLLGSEQRPLSHSLRNRCRSRASRPNRKQQEPRQQGHSQNRYQPLMNKRKHTKQAAAHTPSHSEARGPPCGAGRSSTHPVRTRRFLTHAARSKIAKRAKRKLRIKGTQDRFLRSRVTECDLPQDQSRMTTCMRMTC